MSAMLSASQGCAQLSTARRMAPRSARVVAVRASPDNLVQRPEMKRPEMKSPEAPVAPTPVPVASAASAVAAPPSPAAVSASGGVTLEYQRQRAKEITKYFRDLKLSEQVVKAKVFGWTRQNEINNGRWTMFGLMVGMLTEYATGVDFPNQLKLMASYLGIFDLE